MAQGYEQGGVARERRGMTTPSEFGTSAHVHEVHGKINSDPSEPVVQIQPHPSRYQYQRLHDHDAHQMNQNLFWVKDDENCPCHIMSYLNIQAERIDKPVRAYSHYSLLVYVCNITCVTLLGFPLAFPFMICAVITAKSVRNLNEQNDFISARVCSCCVWASVVMIVLMSMATWTCIALLIYFSKTHPAQVMNVLFVGVFLVGSQFLLFCCGSVCVPLFTHAAKIIRTSREMKSDVKAMMA